MRVSGLRGFTLIELAVVVVIISILCGVALPRLVSMEKDARAAVASSLYHSLRSSANMIYTKVAAAGQLANASYDVDIGDGVTINARYGYPNTDSDENIRSLFEDLSPRVTVGGGGTTRILMIDGRPDCGVSYTRAANPGDRAMIEPPDVSGC